MLCVLTFNTDIQDAETTYHRFTAITQDNLR